MATWTIGESLNIGWKKMKENFLLFLLLLLTLLAAAAVNAIGERIGIGFAVGIVVFVAAIIFDIGLTRITLDLLDGKKAEYKQLYAYPNLFPDYLIGTILYVLIVIGGLILLIVPGIIWALKYQFYKYYIVDKRMGPFEAIKASGRATDGHKWHLLGFTLAVIGVNILGLIALVVGLFLTIPTTEMATAYVYRMLDRGAKAQPGKAVTKPAAKAPTRSKKKR